MYLEDNFRMFMMENVYHKKGAQIEDEGTKKLLGIKLDIHKRFHKK